MRTGREWPSRSAVTEDGDAGGEVDGEADEHERATGPRLLIYSQDGVGLGHLRRTSAIAGEFLRACPNACVLTVSDSPLGTFFGIVLVDHMPHGALGELLPTLDALRSTPAKLVLGLRDILDAPHVVRRRWRAEGAYAAIEEHYDLVLVYGTRSVFDVATQYAWTRNAAARLVYCGYLCSPVAARHAGRIRAKSLALATGNSAKAGRRTSGKANKQAARLVVAMAGGGADAYPLMDALMDAFPRIRASHPCALAMITGPFMPDAKRRHLQARAEGQPVKVRKSVGNIPSYIAAADVVVGMAGYNTTAEVLSSGTPAVLVPRAAPSAEPR